MDCYGSPYSYDGETSGSDDDDDHHHHHHRSGSGARDKTRVILPPIRRLHPPEGNMPRVHQVLVQIAHMSPAATRRYAMRLSLLVERNAKTRDNMERSSRRDRARSEGCRELQGTYFALPLIFNRRQGPKKNRRPSRPIRRNLKPGGGGTYLASGHRSNPYE